MSISKSGRSTVTIRPLARSIRFFRSHRWFLLVIVLLLVLVTGAMLYVSAPFTRLNAQRARWVSQNITAYRIVVKYEIPLYECEQDFEVRDEQITFRHKDECPVTPVVGSNTAQFEPLIVSSLFKRVEEGFVRPACGSNGCVCDGPVGLDVVYDPEQGYPQQLIYRLIPELRWRYLDFWRARFFGNLPCPLNPKSALPYTGETITVISLTPLKPANAPDIGTIPLATSTP